MSWTAVQQRACESAAVSGTVRRTAVAFRMGVGDRAHQYRENVSFLCGRDPRVPPRNAAGQRSLRLPGGSQQRRNGIPKAFSQEFSISSGIGSKSIAQAVKRSIPNMRRSSGTSRFRKDRRHLRPSMAKPIQAWHNLCGRRNTRHRLAGLPDRRIATHARPATGET